MSCSVENKVVVGVGVSVGVPVVTVEVGRAKEIKVDVPDFVVEVGSGVFPFLFGTMDATSAITTKKTTKTTHRKFRAEAFIMYV